MSSSRSPSNQGIISLTRAARANVPSVASMTTAREHKPKGFLEPKLFNKNYSDKCDDGAERRIKVYQPGERQPTCHSPDLSRRGGKARSGFQAGNPGVYVLVLRIDLDLYSIESVEIFGINAISPRQKTIPLATNQWKNELLLDIKCSKLPVKRV